MYTYIHIYIYVYIICICIGGDRARRRPCGVLGASGNFQGQLCGQVRGGAVSHAGGHVRGQCLHHWPGLAVTMTFFRPFFF